MTDQGTWYDGVSAVHPGGMPLRLRAAPQLMQRHEQKALEFTVEGHASAAESLLRRENEGFAGPRRFGHGAAAQDDDVPHDALGCLDVAFSLRVATIGDLAHHDERVGRVLGAGRAEEADHILDDITVHLVSETTLGWTVAQCSDRFFQAQDGLPRYICLQVRPRVH